MSFPNMMAAAALLTLAACGGGGSTGTGNGGTGNGGTVTPPTTPPAPSEPIVLTLTPSAPAVAQNAGTATTFTVSIKSNVAIPSTVNAAIAAKADLFANSSLTALSAQEYEARITTSAALLPGTYTSTIEVKLCTDAAATCRLPLAGSPWQLPVTLTVKKVGTLSPLTAVAGLHAWTQPQYDAARTGYVPATFTPLAFNFRWSVDPDSSKPRRFNPVVIADQRVYLISSETAAGTEPLWKLQSIEESTGQERWRANLGNWSQISAPVLASGSVSLFSAGPAGNSYRLFNLATGQPISQATNPGIVTADYSAPLISFDLVYGQYGDAGTLSKFEPATGKRLWQFTDSRRAGGGWAVSTDGTLVYNYSQGWMLAIDANSGTLAYASASFLPYFGGPATMAPVLSATQLFVTDSDSTGGALAAFNIATGKLNWQVQSSFTSYPALVADVLYAINGGKLEARSAATGAPLWSSPALGAGSPYTQVLATDNLVFAASQSRVVAVDLATHAVVWEYAAGGSMAISENGILYITHPTNGVVAINLR
ncbi:PQQ-binding-like beta-propeller repeat protein [Pseudoduganella sp. UC29_71]|uniref:PQQ-binding-like beta-propeller repeat protein n=1 Tax=Pseudoduganella sp. UC29_71 TaxID=3350174 RepID=UPI0036732BA7